MWSHAWKCGLQCICPLGTCSESHCIAHLTSSILSIFLFAWKKLNRLKADLIDRECAYLWLAGWQADFGMAQSNHSIAGSRQEKEKYTYSRNTAKNNAWIIWWSQKRAEMPWMIKSKQFENSDDVYMFRVKMACLHPLFCLYSQLICTQLSLDCSVCLRGSLKPATKFFPSSESAWICFVKRVSSGIYWFC